MTPRILANENFPAPSTLALRAAGLDVIAIADDHPGMPDPEVMALARAEDRWLLTFDTDYADLVFRRKLPPPPAVLLLRETHYRPAEPATWILRLLATPGEVTGFFCVVSRREWRKRLLVAVVPGPNGAA